MAICHKQTVLCLLLFFTAFRHVLTDQAAAQTHERDIIVKDKMTPPKPRFDHGWFEQHHESDGTISANQHHPTPPDHVVDTFTDNGEQALYLQPGDTFQWVIEDPANPGKYSLYPAHKISFLGLGHAGNNNPCENALTNPCEIRSTLKPPSGGTWTYTYECKDCPDPHVVVHGANALQADLDQLKRKACKAEEAGRQARKLADELEPLSKKHPLLSEADRILIKQAKKAAQEAVSDLNKVQEDLESLDPDPDKAAPDQPR